MLYMPHEAAGADNSPHDYVDRYAYLDCSHSTGRYTQLVSWPQACFHLQGQGRSS